MTFDRSHLEIPAEPSPHILRRPYDPAEACTIAEAATFLGITPTHTRSTDGGSSFAPLKTGTRTISSRSTSGVLTVFEATSSAVYRLEGGLTAGSVDYSISDISRMAAAKASQA